MTGGTTAGIAGRARFDHIRYSQSWEDPATVLGGLSVGPDDDVLSIAASGDNVLSLLLAGPRRIVALDCSPAQLALCELKLAALRRLDHPELLAYLGLLPAPPAHRLRLHAAVAPALTPATRGWWAARTRLVAQGLVHAGRLERYFAHFRTWVLPLLHSPATVDALLRPRNPAEQAAFYREVWSTPAWRTLFRLFFSRTLLGRLGRDPEFFRYVRTHDVGAELLGRVRAGLTAVPTADNYHLHYFLTGRYRAPDHLPHPWRRDSVERLRGLVDRVELVAATLEQHLPRCPAGGYSRFNLSDVFEYVSPAATDALLRELLRVARPGGRLLWFSLFAPRPVPGELRAPVAAAGGQRFVAEPELAASLLGRTRTFFYGGLVVERVEAGR